MDNDESKYKLFSIGHAVEDKPLGTWELWVDPREQMTHSDGIVDNRGQVTDIKGVDSNNVTYTGQMITSECVKATWRGMGQDNRRTAPDVRNGEEVFIYTFADTKQFFWESRNTNTHLRTLETVVWSFSASNAAKQAASEADSYSLEVSTHKKRISLNTSLANGEVTQHTIEINPGTGMLIVQDDSGNQMYMSSETREMEMINSDGVSVHLEQQDLVVTVPGNQNHTVEGSQQQTIGGGLNITVGGAATVIAQTATIQSSLNHLIGETVVTGNLTVSGFTTLVGGATSPNPITAPNID